LTPCQKEKNLNEPMALGRKAVKSLRHPTSPQRAARSHLGHLQLIWIKKQ